MKHKTFLDRLPYKRYFGFCKIIDISIAARISALIPSTLDREKAPSY
jgi:hypothetical protein